MAEFRLPSLGADMETGTLLEWRVAPGDRVRRGDIVAVVDTEKAALEVESFQTGVVERLLVAPGTKVPVGTVLATLRDEGEAPLSTVGAAEGASVATESPPTPAAAVEPSATAESAPRSERIRASIASTMSRSNREIPHYYLSGTIDLGPLVTWLEQRNRGASVENRMLLVAPLLKATALALRDVPELNGFWRDDAFVPSSSIHLGVVTALRGGGLLVPTVTDADSLAIDDLMKVLRDRVSRARSGTLRASEIGQATVTVTSLGDEGAEEVLGVVFPPQVALVGWGGAVQRPWCVDGRIEARPVIRATLAADHRATDGHVGSRWFAEVARRLARPETL